MLKNIFRMLLAKASRKSTERMGRMFGGLFSGLAEQAKSGRAKLEAFEARSTFMTFEEPSGGFFD